MLEAAQRRREEGVDIVVAQMAGHGRSPATTALLTGLERLPSWSPTGPDELAVDAVLARSPQIAIIDELVHSNPPGARHPRRYQDVESC